jgi:uncharacterized protein (TIGR00251 family)
MALKKDQAKTVLINIRLTPRSSKNEVIGFGDGTYRIKVKAPPLDGRANKALIALLSGILRLPKKNIRIKSGDKAREKIVQIQGMSKSEVDSILRKNITP